MMKKWMVAVVIMALLVGPLGGVSVAADQDYAWVLVAIKDYDNQASWDLANAHESYNNEIWYARGNFSVKSSYIGSTQGTKISGEGVKLTAVFSTPPEIIYPGQSVSMDITLSASENSLSFFTFGGYASADFYDPEIDPSYGRGRVFTNGDAESSFPIGGGTNSYATIRETITSTPSNGTKAGDQIAIRQKFYRGVTMATYYVYEWQPLNAVTPSTPKLSFSDLSERHWAYDNIMKMVEIGILNGYTDGTFKPNNTISRAEFAKIMVLALDLNMIAPSASTFSDVSASHWAFKEVESSRDYLTGYRNTATGVLTFEPNGVAVREDVAVAIVKAKGMSNANADLSLLDRFPDQGQISQALRSHIAIAVEHGYMQGSNIGFEPQKALTRAEACTLLARLIDWSRFEEKEKIVF